MTKKILWFIIFSLLIVFIFVLYQGLNRDVRQMPSALLNKELPDFQLESLFDPNQVFNKSILIGEVALVNIWASWCGPCAKEHPLIVEIAKSGVPIYGLNYQDDRNIAIQWLSEKGDPYRYILYDPNGETGIDWGVIAVPETFLIDKDGIVRYRHIGIITEDVWLENILPLYLQYQNEQS